MGFTEIANEIASGIREGKYPDTLPSIRALSEMFSVCPATVKRVISQLRDWDLVFRTIFFHFFGNPDTHSNDAVRFEAALPELIFRDKQMQADMVFIKSLIQFLNDLCI